MNDIPKMERHELDLLTDLLASCWLYGLKDEKEAIPCTLAYERYRVAYTGRRAIDDILFAIQDALSFVRLRERVGDRSKSIERLDRLLDLRKTLRDAVALRNNVVARRIHSP